MSTPDLPPQEPPQIRPAIEIHQPAPARDPEPVLSVVNEMLEAFSKHRQSSLISVLRTHNSSTAASALGPELETRVGQPAEPDSALAQAVAVLQSMPQSDPAHEDQQPTETPGLATVEVWASHIPADFNLQGYEVFRL